jgi:hypothetical protein
VKRTTKKYKENKKWKTFLIYQFKHIIMQIKQNGFFNFQLVNYLI